MFTSPYSSWSQSVFGESMATSQSDLAGSSVQGPFFQVISGSLNWIIKIYQHITAHMNPHREIYLNELLFSSDSFT